MVYKFLVSNPVLLKMELSFNNCEEKKSSGLVIDWVLSVVRTLKSKGWRMRNFHSFL